MAVSSKRYAQAKVSRVGVTSGLLFALALVLSLYSARHPWTGDARLQIATILLRPLQALDFGVRSRIERTWTRYISLVNVERRNEQLNSQVQVLESDSARLEEATAELARLRELLNIKQTLGQSAVVAHVIGRDPSNWVFALTIDKGQADGIRPGLAALSGNSLVGQVVNVAENSSRVLLINDYASGVDVLLQSSRARGVVTGAGDDCELQFVNRDDDLHIGDRVITSGMDGVFGKGILVGIVSELGESTDTLFHRARIKPTASLHKLEELLILGAGSTSTQNIPSIPSGAKK